MRKLLFIFCWVLLRSHRDIPAHRGGNGACPRADMESAPAVGMDTPAIFAGEHSSPLRVRRFHRRARHA